MSLGDLIRSCEISIPEIAEKMGVDQAQVMAWVCGEVPDAKFAIRLSEVLGVPLEKLYLAVLHTHQLMA